MRHQYAKEKLGSAVHSMATGKGDIKIRLWHAYLIFHTLSEKDFGDEFKEDWNLIYNSLTKEEASYDTKGGVTSGKVENTLKVLDEETCVEIAERISNLTAKLRHH